MSASATSATSSSSSNNELTNQPEPDSKPKGKIICVGRSVSNNGIIYGESHILDSLVENCTDMAFSKGYGNCGYVLVFASAPSSYACLVNNGFERVETTQVNDSSGHVRMMENWIKQV